jgi:ABC-type sugar transport system ATPase subunit
MKEPVRISIRHVAKSYDHPSGRIAALRDVELTVEPGELMVLLGPNGSGKTTLLRLLAGLDSPDSGEILFSDRVVVDAARRVSLKPEARNVSMVFQNYPVYPHLSVADNIAFPLRIRDRKMPREEIRQRVLEVAKLLEIEPLLQRRPMELSAGQRQRLAVAKAIVRTPDVLLLDEPLSNIDEKLRMEARLRLRRLQKATGITTVYVTHDQREVMAIGDRVALLNGGVIEQSGTPRELYEDPWDAFVAGYMGPDPLNVLEGRLVQREGQPYFRFDGLESRLAPQVVPLLRGSDEEALVLAVRPEDLSVQHQGSGLADGQVALVRNIGSDYLITVFLDNGKQLLARTRTPPEGSRPGSRCSVSFDPARSLLFDQRGRRIGRSG